MPHQVARIRSRNIEVGEIFGSAMAENHVGTDCPGALQFIV